MHNPTLLCSPQVLPTKKKMSDFPNDIMVEILLRLPAKYLLRLRWTCKYWFDLITRDHDGFIKMHLLHHHSTQSMINTVSHSVLISKTNSKNYYPEKIFKSYLNYNTGEGEEDQEASSISPSHVRIAFPFEPHRFDVLGSCNGLVLCTPAPLHRRNIIWNPCTNEYKVIPKPPIIVSTSFTCGLRYDRAICGLGYDSTIDDYKVIRIIYNFERSGHDIQVYTLGTNSWKSIEHDVAYDNVTMRLYNGVFVNEALYWIVPKSEYCKIYSFDFVKENFQEVPVSLPPEWKMGYRHLQVFEGSLYCIIVYPRVVEIWIMNKDFHGVNNDKYSLTKLYTYIYDRPYTFHVDKYRLLRFTKSGEILMLNNDKHLCLCGSNNNKLERIKTICDPYYFVKEVYTESLVSLKSGTYARTQVKNSEK